MAVKIIKKDGSLEDYNFKKVKNAVSKSSSRVSVNFTDKDWEKINNFLTQELEGVDKVTVDKMHNLVEDITQQISPKVAQSYREYRNYKKDYAKMMSNVLENADQMNYKIDRSNANTTAALISTKRSLIYTELNKERYKKFELKKNYKLFMMDIFIFMI